VAQINIDFAAMTEKIEAEINEPRIMINDAFTRNPYLTRLYSTMSAHEMTLDPMFGWNRDLPAQSNIRNAVRRIRCVMGTPDWDNATIETESGIVFREEDGSNPNVVLRQEGETIRGQEDLPAAQVITEQRPAGMSRVIMDNTAQIRARVEPTSGSGCACDASGTGTGGLIWLGLLLLPALLRRRS
jgi:MYXO-CTERM domain-containing protein